MKRWACPKCGIGKLAPAKLSRTDTRRWCLACSAESPTLVERHLPGRAVEIAKRKEARKDRLRSTKERASAKSAAYAQHLAELAARFDRPRQSARAWLTAWIPRILALKTWDRERDPSRTWPPEIEIRQGGDRTWASGHAYTGRRSRLVVTTGAAAADDLATLIHEIAHCAAKIERPQSGAKYEIHGPRFRNVEASAIEDLVGHHVAPERAYTQRGNRAHSATVQAWMAGNGGAVVDMGATRAAAADERERERSETHADL